MTRALYLICLVSFLSVSPAAARAADTADAAVAVNALNFVQARTALQFAAVLERSGAVNRFGHVRGPIPLDQQRSKRMNRDTLYSSAVVDISKGAVIHLPDAGERYLSATVYNEDHFINRIFHAPGSHRLTVEEFDTPFVLVTVRILADASDPADIERANRLQDALRVEAEAARPYAPPVYDQASLARTAEALRALAADLPSEIVETFGRREDVHPIRHLTATAYGWGGLPEYEVSYLNIDPGLPVGAYALTVRDVPVDGFWSISVYDSTGEFRENPWGAYSVNDLTAEENPDGSVTVRFGGDPEAPNFLAISEGWNYVVRLYRPRPEVVEGRWRFPEVAPVR